MPRQTNYRKGYDLEQKARRELEARGYYVVRSAGSHGAVDLVALADDHILLIQVGSLGSKNASDYEKLGRVKGPPGTGREMWLWRRRVGWGIEAVSVRVHPVHTS